MRLGILRYYVLASGFVFVLAFAVVFYFCDKTASRDLFNLAEYQNVTLAGIVANEIRTNAPDHFEIHGATDFAAPHHKAGVARIRSNLKKLLRDLPVRKVEILLDGRTIYSPDPGGIGTVKSGGIYAKAVETGASASEIHDAGSLDGVSAARVGRHIMESYVPFGTVKTKDGHSHVLAVGVASDITPLVKRVSETKTNLIVTLLLIFAVLYGISFLIVRWANARTLRQSKLIHLLSQTANDANSAASFEEAMQDAIHNICVHTGWPIGHVFCIDDGSPDLLVSEDIWYIGDADRFAEFKSITEQTTFGRGIGLPGQVLQSGAPVWITETPRDKNFVRSRAARVTGIKAGFACPVVMGEHIVAILEFFATEAVPPDAALLETLVQIGVQLGRVAERNKAEAEIRASEDRFRDFAGAASDWFWEMDSDLRVTFLSKRYTEVTGLKSADLLGKNWSESGVQDEFKPDVMAQDLADFNARRPFRNFNYSHTKPDGTVVWMTVSGTPYFAVDGTFAGYRGTGTDVTKLKQREMALRDSEERFRAFIENSPSAIMIKDIDGRYVSANKRWHDYFNPDGTEIFGKAAYDFYPKAYADDIAAIDRKIVATGEPLASELTTPYADGTEQPTLVQKFPIFDQNGEICAIGGTVTDITDQRNAEEQLRQSQKMEAVGQLTGGIAHDFNNLLGVVIGNLDFLAEELCDNPDHAGLLDAATKAALNCASLNRQLLAFSRKQPLRPRVIDLNAQVTGLYEMLSRTLGESITIETNLREALWTCEADPAQVETALLNLAINARDAMPSGGKLSIATANVKLRNANEINDVQPGEYVTLAVTDTGIGMTPDIIEHVFEPFFTTKGVGEGSGLGLSMVFGFAKQSGGNVTVRSIEGDGATVTLFLPRACHAETLAIMEPEHGPLARGETVLVVEDDDGVLELAVSLLDDLGYRILQARDAAAALAILSDNSGIDLLLTDVVLPSEINGPMLAEKARCRDSDIKVLFMSGYTQDMLSTQGRFDDDVLLLQKPFRKTELANKLRDALHAHN